MGIRTPVTAVKVTPDPHFPSSTISLRHPQVVDAIDIFQIDVRDCHPTYYADLARHIPMRFP